jgi:hypothetical protein
MTIRCIGGPCHGIGMTDCGSDAFPVKYNGTVSVYSGLVDKVSETHTRHHYTKRRVVSCGSVIYFYAPLEWSDFDALMVALT